mgnify:CR=1 FL=1
MTYETAKRSGRDPHQQRGVHRRDRLCGHQLLRRKGHGGPLQGLVHLLKRESMAKGVKVYYNEDGTVSIELHIIVENGVNLVAVCRSIMSEVRYVVSKTTGVEVKSVDVCVDSMRF